MILLDTHIRHWWTNQINGKLDAGTIALIEEADEVAISAISCFEQDYRNCTRTPCPLAEF